MSTTRSRSERLEVRTTKEERALIDRAVAEQGTDLTEFVVSHPTSPLALSWRTGSSSHSTPSHRSSRRHRPMSCISSC